MNHTEKITEIINAVQNISNVGICFYDLENFFHYNTLGIKDNRGHYCEFCKCIRLLENGRKECDKSDRFEAISYAKKYKKQFFFKCHMGMNELCVPLFAKEKLLGIVFVGQCRTEDSDMNYIRKRINEMKGNEELLLAHFMELPLVNKETMLDTAKIISNYFEAITNKEDYICIKGFEAANTPLPEKISEYINSNYRYRITTGELGKKLYMNPSYLSRIFKEYKGITITEYTNRVRIENAKRLLEISQISISSIAMNVGFNDSNYFSRIFKKITGLTPELYRKSIHKAV
ncbi:MAG: PocR ligand-binding domain-containing protein [Clostridia bacterium]|nr:PocR ligand-binding domain-containing protein [Clostridia bacterium]